MNFWFFFNSALLGTGLAMDAFSVSLANGLSEPKMSKKKLLAVALTFAFFQAVMPLIGWVLVHTMVEIFGVVESLIPWVALALLSFIGGKMLFEGISDIRSARCCGESSGEDCNCGSLTLSALLVQGIATSIDALSVGFTISEYGVTEALVCAAIIAVVTFVICCVGIALGKRFGTVFAGKSAILGGAILIFIGLEIFVTSFFS